MKYLNSLLAVADGVGGWADRGVDPAEYSRALIKKYKFIHNTSSFKMFNKCREKLQVECFEIPQQP